MNARPDRKTRPEAPSVLTTARLRDIALQYLGRQASSEANLRRVLARRLARAARGGAVEPAEARARIDDVIAGLSRSGLLDDRAFAEGRAASLRRRGFSAHGIRARLRAQGVDRDLIEAALAAHDRPVPLAELAAALAYARRRRLGPYRAKLRRQYRDKDLASLSRAGFPYDIARRIVEAATAEELEGEVGG